jgi:hypothetical protein
MGLVGPTLLHDPRVPYRLVDRGGMRHMCTMCVPEYFSGTRALFMYQVIV